MGAPLVSIQHLKKHFPVGDRQVIAVHDFNLDIAAGETVGLVGESGCGKSTVGRTLLRLHEPTSGKFLYDGVDVFSLSSTDMQAMRRRMQMIFQDPYASLNPRLTAGEIIGEALTIHGLAKGAAWKARVEQLLELVGLRSDHCERYPHEFSGGQRQRIGIARALAVEPQFLICDEPLSALDVSVRAQIVNLLQDLQQKLQLTYLFIAHDLSMIEHLSHRVAVMYLGNLVELASSQELYAHPLHPYTQALLASIPLPDPRLERQRSHVVVSGDIPSNSQPPSGCVFRTRCPYAMPICSEVTPPLHEVAPGHFVACHLKL